MNKLVLIAVVTLLSIACQGFGEPPADSLGTQRDFGSIAREKMFGKGTLFILPQELKAGQLFDKPRDIFSPKDVDAIKQKCPSVATVAPIVSLIGVATFEERTWYSRETFGTTPDYWTLRSWDKPAKGRALSHKDLDDAAPVCVLGQTVARKLFEENDALGKLIRIKGTDIRVVGVLDAKGRDLLGDDQDDIVLLPSTVVARIKKTDRIDAIIAKAKSGASAGAAKKEITEVLRQRHNLDASHPDDFRFIE